MIALDPHSSTPMYLQLHDAIVRAIAHGELPPGTKLVSVRAVASDFGINPATVKQAYDLLQDHGVIITRGRSGSYVAPQQQADDAPLREAVDLLLAQGWSFSQIKRRLAALEAEMSTHS